MDRKQVMEMFNRKTRIGALATANNDGDVNAAVFGSPRMIDEDTVIMAIGDNRSYQNLQENPKASFIVIEPGVSPMQWKGVRLYLELDAFERYGELLDSYRENIRKMAGDQSADAIVAALRFKITDVRPLIAPTAQPQSLETDFFTPNVLDTLVKTFDIKPIATADEDLEAILG